MCRNIRAALPRALNTITDEAGVSRQYFHLGAVVLNNKWHSWTFFFLSRTHRHTSHRPCQHAQTSRSSSSGEKFPVDILCFWHNIDFRGKAAGGLLVNFHITLEEDAEQTGGGEGWMVGWTDKKYDSSVLKILTYRPETCRYASYCCLSVFVLVVWLKKAVINNLLTVRV